MSSKACNAGVIMVQSIMTQARYIDLVWAAITSDGHGAMVNLPQGIIELSSTPMMDGEPLWKQFRGGGQRGHGMSATEFQWVGGLDEPMFIVDRCQGVMFDQFGIRVSEDNPLLEGIRIQQGAAVVADKRFTNLTSSLNIFSNIEIAGSGYCGTGIRVYLYDVDNDDKNDHHSFLNLHIVGTRNAGMVLEGRNAKALEVQHLVFTGTVGGSQLCDYGIVTVANFCPLTMNADGTIGTRGDPAVNGGAPVFNHGAAFSCEHGQISGTLVSNVLVGDRNDPLTLHDLYSEKSAMWLQVPDYGQGSSGAFPIRLSSLKYSVNVNTPADNIIIDVRSQSLEIDNCEFGQRVVGQQIAINFQPVNSPGAFVLNASTITNDGDGNVFTYQAPTNTDYGETNSGYRAGTLGPLGPGVIVPTDGPALRIYPHSVAQWQEAGLPNPASQWDFSDVPTPPTDPWPAATEVLAGEYCTNDGGKVYLCVGDGVTAGAGGPTGVGSGIVDGTATWDYYGTGAGVLYDLVSSKDILIVNTYTFNQALAGFTQSFILQPEVAATALELNSTAYSPITDAVAVVVDFQVVASGGNRKLLQLGNTNTTVGGGGIIFIITAAGLLQINCNGVTVNGVTNYEGDGTVHRLVAYWDPAGAGSLFAATDTEKIVGVPAPAAVLNSSDKGFGAPAATAVNAYLGGYPAWFYGADAITIGLSASRTLLGVNAT